MKIAQCLNALLGTTFGGDGETVFGLPDLRGREQILKVHMRKVPIGANVEPSKIARGTPGFSGADLESLVNEAALLAARKDKDKVDMRDFEEAKDKVLMGPERKSMVISEKEKRITAVHEAGHALVSLFMPKCDPLHKVTIIPRGNYGGATFSLPERDRYGYGTKWLRATMRGSHSASWPGTMSFRAW